MSNKDNPNRIRVGEKMAFGLANLGNLPIMTLIGSFLLIFYTDIAGIDPAAVATLFIIARVLDGVNDPIMGFIIDHLPKSKMGRFRPYLLIGVIVCSINYLLLWFGPIMFPGIKLVIVYITYLLIGISFDMMDIPLNSLLPVMTSDMKERASLSTIKGACIMAGSIIVMSVGPLVLKGFGGGFAGYAALIVGGTVVALAFSIIGVLGVKERVQPIEEEKYKIKDVIPMLLQRPVLTTFLTVLIYSIGTTGSSSVNIFFATYILDNKLEVLSVVGLIQMLTMFIGMFIGQKLTNKLGKKALYSGTFILAGAAGLIRLLAVTSVPLYYISAVIVGISGGAMMTNAFAIQADNIDYIEYKKGIRAEGALASLNSFVAKAAGGIGGAIPGYVLAATGYVAHQEQSPSARLGIIAVTIIVPAVFTVIAGIIFILGYNINKHKLEEVITTLKARRDEKESNKK
ncbi:MAG TPA: MFS transporter [Clostridiales bacterium]|nr:MFS transporter [Clostridiales bacterium]